MRIINFDGKIKKKDIFQFLYGFLFVLMISYVSEEFIPGRLSLQKKMLVVIAIVGIICFLYKNIDYVRGKYWSVISLFCLPFIISAFYSVLICTISGDDIGTSKQSITTAMFIIVDLLVVVAISFFFDIKSITLLSVSLIGAYVYAIIMEIQNNGFTNAINHLVSKSIERNDIGVAVVPLILYYFFNLFVNKKKEKFTWFFLFVLLLVMFFCGKRSAILSLIVGILLIIVVKLFRKESIKILFLLATLTILFCWIYVFGIHMDFFDTMMVGKGTLSDRYYVWKKFDNMYTISPFYLGYGFGFIHRYMMAGLGDWMVNSYGYLHNSILQLYIETGFFGFCIWLGIYLLLIPFIAKKKYGNGACIFTIISVISMFAMFTVDNTLTYPLYQICLYGSLYSVYRLEEIDQEGIKVLWG